MCQTIKDIREERVIDGRLEGLIDGRNEGFIDGRNEERIAIVKHYILAMKSNKQQRDQVKTALTSMLGISPKEADEYLRNYW